MPFHTLVKLSVHEDNKIDKIRTLDLRLEIMNVTSKLKSQNLSVETYDPKPEVLFTQTTDPNIRSTPQFRKYCKCYHESNHSVSNYFRKQRKDEERSRIYVHD